MRPSVVFRSCSMPIARHAKAAGWSWSELRVVSMMRIPCEMKLLTCEVTSMSSSTPPADRFPVFATAPCYLIPSTRATLFAGDTGPSARRRTRGADGEHIPFTTQRVIEPPCIGVRSGRDSTRTPSRCPGGGPEPGNGTGAVRGNAPRCRGRAPCLTVGPTGTCAPRFRTTRVLPDSTHGPAPAGL